ncbi:MAG TPA: hypothetical protein PLT26_16770 [Anaerolineaceae bacterium]|nr:hypothetical protein [Anaerolineaceae bacterium]
MNRERKRPVYTWIKSYHALLDSPRYLRLSLEARAIYHECYLLAGRAGAGGLICDEYQPFEVEDIAFQLHVGSDIVMAALAELVQAGFIENDGGWIVTRFLDEQGADGDCREVERETWRKRQETHRARIRNGKRTVPETSEKQTASDEDEKQNRQDETRRNQNRGSRDSHTLSHDSHVTITDDNCSVKHEEYELILAVGEAMEIDFGQNTLTQLHQLLQQDREQFKRITNWIIAKKSEGNLRLSKNEGKFLAFFENAFENWFKNTNRYPQAQMSVGETKDVFATSIQEAEDYVRRMSDGYHQ